MRYLTFVILSITFMLFIAFQLENSTKEFVPLNKLSSYGFFQGELKNLQPDEDVIPYDLNTPLFSDYAKKARFFKVPKGKKIGYEEYENFSFPLGSILIKNFYYPIDFRKPEGKRKILETRLLILTGKGWTALPYIWNNEQTEAFLEVAGGTIAASWKNERGKKININYSVPNVNQCKGCHNKNKLIKPIGPTARQLNRDYDFTNGRMNQLKFFEMKVLIDLPEFSSIPRASVWNEPKSGTVDQRARDYLDINCAHCHNPEAPANTSGLFLNINQKNAVAFGIMKTPVAAGRGSGGNLYDIVPGNPSESILLYRMQSTDPGVMMPEIGRSMVHREGVELIKEWIRKMGKE